MTAIFIRTIFMYVSMMLVVRLMGKRQIGELQMTEFISAVLLSEIAALPITDRDIPLLYGILPLFVIGSFEVVLALPPAGRQTDRTGPQRALPPAQLDAHTHLARGSRSADPHQRLPGHRGSGLRFP